MFGVEMRAYGRPGLVDERGWLIFFIYQNTIEHIAQWLLLPVNGMITHNCRTIGGEKKSRKRVITVCCFL